MAATSASLSLHARKTCHARKTNAPLRRLLGLPVPVDRNQGRRAASRRLEPGGRDLARAAGSRAGALVDRVGDELGGLVSLLPIELVVT
jgi:hypothetical protein